MENIDNLNKVPFAFIELTKSNKDLKAVENDVRFDYEYNCASLADQLFYGFIYANLSVQFIFSCRVTSIVNYMRSHYGLNSTAADIMIESFLSIFNREIIAFKLKGEIHLIKKIEHGSKTSHSSISLFEQHSDYIVYWKDFIHCSFFKTSIEEFGELTSYDHYFSTQEEFSSGTKLDHFSYLKDSFILNMQRCHPVKDVVSKNGFSCCHKKAIMDKGDKFLNLCPNPVSYLISYVKNVNSSGKLNAIGASSIQDVLHSCGVCMDHTSTAEMDCFLDFALSGKDPVFGECYSNIIQISEIEKDLVEISNQVQAAQTSQTDSSGLVAKANKLSKQKHRLEERYSTLMRSDAELFDVIKLVKSVMPISKESFDRETEGFIEKYKKDISNKDSQEIMRKIVLDRSTQYKESMTRIENILAGPRFGVAYFLQEIKSNVTRVFEAVNSVKDASMLEPLMRHVEKMISCDIRNVGDVNISLLPEVERKFPGYSLSLVMSVLKQLTGSDLKLEKDPTLQTAKKDIADLRRRQDLQLREKFSKISNEDKIRIFDEEDNSRARIAENPVVQIYAEKALSPLFMDHIPIDESFERFIMFRPEQLALQYQKIKKNPVFAYKSLTKSNDAAPENRSEVKAPTSLSGASNQIIIVRNGKDQTESKTGLEPGKDQSQISSSVQTNNKESFQGPKTAAEIELQAKLVELQIIQAQIKLNQVQNFNSGRNQQEKPNQQERPIQRRGRSIPADRRNPVRPISSHQLNSNTRLPDSSNFNSPKAASNHNESDNREGRGRTKTRDEEIEGRDREMDDDDETSGEDDSVNEEDLNSLPQGHPVEAKEFERNVGKNRSEIVNNKRNFRAQRIPGSPIRDPEVKTRLDSDVATAIGFK